MAVSPTFKPSRGLPDSPHLYGEAIFLDSSRPGQTLQKRFANPSEIIAVYDLDEVPATLKKVENRVESGMFAAGFVAYEAGAAFEKAMPRRTLHGLPYLWFALFADKPETVAFTPAAHSPLQFHSGLTRDEYNTAIDAIRQWIAAGDTYQVNFTFPMQAAWNGNSRDAFFALAESQRDAEFRTYLDTGAHQVASVSPELFFRLDGNRIVTRPMKGTARRHPDPLRDLESAARLRESPKELAENLMIVDLLRNDLGRIAETGSVQVDRLFDVERYQTLHTMTSTISATTKASVPEIFAALFPSGSVTGAPKIRTMQIIHETEREPRGVYCGAIGWWGPNRRAEFSVGIRTLVIDAANQSATYRVGSGITWDSDTGAEYDECLLKAAVLNDNHPEFDLLESLRLENGVYWLLDRHLERLRTSAKYFGRPCDETAIRAALQTVRNEHLQGICKVRLLLFTSGRIETTSETLSPARPWRVAIAERPVPSQSPFVYNKTTHRAHYAAATEGCSDADDVILFNEQGELTESTRANLVVDIGGKSLTPPRAAGLLPGTFREELLAQGAIEERRLTLTDLRRATRVRLVNSVRGWIEIEPLELPGERLTP